MKKFLTCMFFTETDGDANADLAWEPQDYCTVLGYPLAAAVFFRDRPCGNPEYERNAVLPNSHRRFTCVQFRLLHSEP